MAIGCSAGGVDALRVLFGKLPADYPNPIFVTIHRGETDSDRLVDLLNSFSTIKIVSPDDKERIESNRIYLAPVGYHLQVERNFRLSLSVDPPIHNCRPAIDVMFETAAWAYGPDLVGIVLTGANDDGSLGLKTIRECGGLTIAESPKTARFPMMPEAAIKATQVDHILTLDEIATLIPGF